jgi:hypothetical protein
VRGSRSARRRTGGGTLVLTATSGGPPQRGDTTTFSHARHRSLRCTTCHTTERSHGELKAGVARDCSGCHHGDTPIGRACERCHQAAEMATPRAVTATVTMAVRPVPTTKSLSFDHQRHARLACGQCHASGVSHAVQTTCTSCHADHHQASRTCSGCHASALATHTRAVHVTGCGGAGCHATEATPATSTARAVCLACHAQQADHKPGRECAACHLTSWRAVSAARAP